MCNAGYWRRWSYCNRCKFWSWPFFSIKGTATKLKPESVPNDDNQVASSINQQNITVKQNGNIITVKATNLENFVSTDSEQALLGAVDWIGLEIETGADDITKIKYNGTALTAKDVTEADSLGLKKGSFILWTPYSKLPKTFTLSTETESKTITIKRA